MTVTLLHFDQLHSIIPVDYIRNKNNATNAANRSQILYVLMPLADDNHSLFRHNFKPHFFEIFIFLKHYHGDWKTGFVVKMKLHSSRWVSQEITLVLHRQSLKNCMLIMLYSLSKIKNQQDNILTATIIVAQHYTMCVKFKHRH